MVNSTLCFDLGDFNPGDEGQIGVADIAGFDRGVLAVTEQAQKLAQPPARESHVMGGEKQLETILGRIGFLFCWHLNLVGQIIERHKLPDPSVTKTR